MNNRIKSRYLRVMLLSLLFLLTAGQINAKVVYFKNTRNWNPVKVHMWGDASGDVDMTSTGVDNWYSCEIPDNANNLLFYNGNWSGDNQTADLTYPTDGRNAYDGGKWGIYENGNFSVYFLAGSFNGWSVDGTVMTNNDGVWSYTIEGAQVAEYKLKVTNGTWDSTWGYDNVDSENSNVTFSTDNDRNVVFTPTEAGDITISFNAETKKITVTVPVPTPVEAVYTIVGDAAIVNGDAWTTSTKDNDMVKGVDGTYTLTVEKTGLAVSNYDYKVVKNHKWGDGEYPAGQNNQTLSISEAGDYTITYSFNPETPELTANAVKTGPTTIAFVEEEKEYNESVTVHLTVGYAPEDSKTQYQINEADWTEYTEDGIVITETSTVKARVLASDNETVLATAQATYTINEPEPVPETIVYIITPENGSTYKTNKAFATLTKSDDNDNLFTGRLEIPGNKFCISTTLGTNEEDWSGFNVGRINFTNVSLVESGTVISFTHGGDGNEYTIRSGFYDVEIDLEHNTAKFTQNPEPEFKGVFIIGNEGDWSTNAGTKLIETAEGSKVYKGVIRATSGYFAVGTLRATAADDYVTFNSGKLGAPNDNYQINADGNTVNLSFGYDNSFKANTGVYEVTVDVDAMTIALTPVPASMLVEHHSEFKPAATANAYKNTVTVTNLVTAGTYNITRKAGNASNAVTFATVTVDANGNYSVAYNNTTDNRVVYDDGVANAGGRVADGIVVDDYFYAFTVDGGDLAGTYTYAISELDGVTSDAIDIPAGVTYAYLVSDYDNDKIGYTLQEILEDRNDPLGESKSNLKVPEGVAIYHSNWDNDDLRNNATLYRYDIALEPSSVKFRGHDYNQFTGTLDGKTSIRYAYGYKVGENTYGTRQVVLPIADVKWTLNSYDYTITSHDGIYNYNFTIDLELNQTVQDSYMFADGGFRAWRTCTTWKEKDGEPSRADHTLFFDNVGSAENFTAQAGGGDAGRFGASSLPSSTVVKVSVRAYYTPNADPSPGLTLDDKIYYVADHNSEITFGSSPVTGIEDVEVAGSAVKAYKVIENGQVIIVRGDQRFNIMGQPVR